MKRHISAGLLTTLIALALLLSTVPTHLPGSTGPAYAQGPDQNITDGCVEDYDPAANYFPQQATIQYAENFTVEYFNTYKLVTILTPYTGAEPVQYALVQCGTPAPDDLGGATVVEVPRSTLITMSTSYLPFVAALGLTDQLLGHDEFDYVSTPDVRARIDAGAMVEIGEGATANVELVLDLEPSLIMAYTSGFPEYEAYPVLAEAGLPVVLNAEYMETNPLGRAEWIKYLALFYNLEAEAAAQFDAVASAYTDLQALAATVEQRPTVFTDAPFEGTWYMAGGASFTAQLLADAGADYVYADDDSTGSLYLDFETVFERAADAEFWVNAGGFWFSRDDALAADERFAEFAAFQNGNVWSNNLRLNDFGGSDYYEGGVANPHLILADLIAIFHPDLLPDHAFTYYRQLD